MASQRATVTTLAQWRRKAPIKKPRKGKRLDEVFVQKAVCVGFLWTSFRHWQKFCVCQWLIYFLWIGRKHRKSE